MGRRRRRGGRIGDRDIDTTSNFSSCHVVKMNRLRRAGFTSFMDAEQPTAIEFQNAPNGRRGKIC